MCFCLSFFPPGYNVLGSETATPNAGNKKGVITLKIANAKFVEKILLSTGFVFYLHFFCFLNSYFTLPGEKEGFDSKDLMNYLKGHIAQRFGNN